MTRQFLDRYLVLRGLLVPGPSRVLVYHYLRGLSEVLVSSCRYYASIFIFPLWKKARNLVLMKYFLKGVTVTVASLILMTAIKSAIKLPVNYVSYAVVLSTALLLISKIPAPLIVLAGILDL